MATAFRDQQVFTLLAVAYIAAVAAVARIAGRPDALSLSLYSPVLTALLAVALPALALGHLVYLALIVRPPHPLRRVAEDWTQRFLALPRLAAALPVLLLLPLFMSAFTSMKVLIAVINPFSWDPAFAQWDRALHGGVDPWRLLQPLLGRPAGTAIINLLYHKWFLVVNGVLLWQTFSLEMPALRRRFFIAFVLSWILLGSGMALALPAAGPCYFGRVTGLPDPFRPLMDYLSSVHDLGWNPAYAVQELLWRHYVSGDPALGGGISAMPSMHVALAVLFALLGWRYGRGLGIMFTVFAATILVGSVHLGWHYAIDGYVAIPGVWLIWFLAGHIAHDRPKRLLPAPQSSAPAL
jgi:PAP2 superfamily